MSGNREPDVKNPAAGGAPLLAYSDNVYSQNGEDGIIAAALAKLPTPDRWCVEFGAWDGIYLSNTRNLIENKGYRAVLIEASRKHFAKLKQNVVGRDGVIALNAFVGFSTKDSLDVLLSATPCPLDFDFLSIDIDGNDIHVWRAIKRYRPKLVCIEFNPTIPTEEIFEQPADPKVNWGSSLGAIVRLAREKRYELICVNEFNALFIVSELYPLFPIIDNSPSALRPREPECAKVYVGYDGTLFLTRDISVPWHGITFSTKDIQPLPAVLRKYPPRFNLIEKYLARAYKVLHRARKFVRLNDRPSTALAHKAVEFGKRSLRPGRRAVRTKIKKIARQVFGDRLTGRIEYYCRPSRRQFWGGPFNGQPGRQALFSALIELIRPAAILETGTFLGSTAEFMAKTGLPVYSIEGDPLHYGFAQTRLRKLPNVVLLENDSRSGLREFFNGPLRPQSHRSLFVYLDAHWGSDLPLAEELDIVFSRCPTAVVMIDDFQVPDDPDYTYDDFGSGKALTAEYIADALDRHSLAVFYPAIRGSDEGGKRRGCVVLARKDDQGARLGSLGLLRPHAKTMTPDQDRAIWVN